ncbi:MAG: ribonuclease [Microbacteriaceae bacterium]|jgi:ribonuclease HII|nr:ribonuclease [Microbacteriaceae bacterium]HEV7956508.1 ribonuclease HII [Marisediminicola sp.]
MAVVDPTLEIEASLHEEGHRYVIGCDEVGRGAIAGPVAVGLAIVDVTIGSFPNGLRDSKLLSEKRREQLEPLTIDWALHTAVGLSSAAEVDEWGLTAALGMAGRRALAGLHTAGASIRESVILLDGSFDWLNPALTTPLLVRTRVKADRDCASVAAASVVAKVHRDRLMIEADAGTPGYGWAGNKGYGSAGHFAAIAELGATDLHRRSWLKRQDPTVLG